MGQRPTSGALALLGWCVAILVLQAAASRWWLRRFRQGPLEAAWRHLTWGFATIDRGAGGPGGRSGTA